MSDSSRHTGIDLRPARVLSNVLWAALPGWDVGVEERACSDGGGMFAVHATCRAGAFTTLLPGNGLDMWELAEVVVGQMTDVLKRMGDAPT